MTTKNKLQRVTPDFDELLPSDDARSDFEEASAAQEAGRLVRGFRRFAGITQTQLAERLSIAQGRISVIEKGEGRDGPTYGLLKRIAHACGADWPAMGLSSELDRKNRMIRKMKKKIIEGKLKSAKTGRKAGALGIKRATLRDYAKKYTPDKSR
jgi:transcriptional regulator with XRE-family HTH domain